MWKRFIKAMEYRAYCMGIRELNALGMYNHANEVADYKRAMYDQGHN